jgi:multiple sugar transport system ATP-binding protein
MAQIRVSQLHKAFANFVAVQSSTFTVKDGEFFCLLGPSGCGKTTTLRMIAGLELPTAGQIFLGDEDVSFKRASARDIAFVFQMFALYPHMNVAKNIAFPLVAQGMAKSEIERRVNQAAQTLQITPLLNSSVSGLSSGDRQRVALGRAIVREPLAFLMDEPLGALDAEFREVMCHELRQLHDRLGATTVYVTHDQTEAMSMADTIAIMNRGVIEQLGPPLEVYERPASVFVADFIGSPSMNFIPFQSRLELGVDTIDLAGISVPVPALREPTDATEFLLGVRPENIRLDSSSTLRAQIMGSEYMGSSQMVTLQLASGVMVKAKAHAGFAAQRAQPVGLTFDVDAISIFDKATGKALRTIRHG